MHCSGVSDVPGLLCKGCTRSVPQDGLTFRVHGTKAALARVSVPWNEAVRHHFLICIGSFSDRFQAVKPMDRDPRLDHTHRRRVS